MRLLLTLNLILTYVLLTGCSNSNVTVSGLNNVFNVKVNSPIMFAAVDYGECTAWSTGCSTYSGGSIYRSADSGVTWSTDGLGGTNHWSSLAGSDDGKKLVASAGGYLTNSYIYQSVDSGSTWMTSAAPIAAYNGLASSSDGSVVGATVYDGTSNFYFSKTGGSGWSSTTIPGGSWWGNVSCSSDGKKWFAANSGDSATNTAVWTGTFDLASIWGWIRNQLGYSYLSFYETYGAGGMSGDGTKLVAASPKHLFYSADSGATWTNVWPNNLPTNGNYPNVIISRDGSFMVMTVYASDTYSYIYTTGTAGLSASSWTQRMKRNDIYIGKVAVSADGARILAASTIDTAQTPIRPNSGYLYLSADAGANFVEITAQGKRLWNGVYIR